MYIATRSALAVYRKGDFKKRSTLLTKLMDHKDVSRQLYRSFWVTPMTWWVRIRKLFEIYDKGSNGSRNGRAFFPRRGNVYWSKKEYGEGVAFYEAGIQADPSYPSTTSRAALIFCSSQNGLGHDLRQIFYEPEPNSKRTAAMSKLLYDTYKSEIKFPTDTTMTTSFG